MSYILNIGMARKGLPNLSPLAVARALRAQGFKSIEARVLRSSTELTFVCEVERDIPEISGFNGYVRRLAASLGQEVIPVYKTKTRKGVMLGATIDLDDSWGAFDPAEFILIDGSRLAVKGA